MKIQNKFLVFVALILSIFLISQFLDFTLTGYEILNTSITKSSQKISDTQGNFNEILDNSDGFGGSVTSIGDLDNDGIIDIVVGTNTDDDGGTNRGAVYILFMNTNGTVKSSQKISDTAGNFLEILNDSDFFGRSVASIGDLDGDGITDIVVGAIGDDDGNESDPNANRGAIYILFMNTNGTVNSSQKISDTTGNFNESLIDGDGFGGSVTSIGDLDGDNITDIVVGADGDDDGGNAHGAVYVLFMNTNGTVKSSQKISDTQGNFNEILDTGDQFGRSVTSIGDLDGDSITDIVVGAFGDDDGDANRGAVYVLFMNTNGTVKSSQKISDTAGNFNEELNNGDQFGISVTSIGDLDNDGIIDIVVGTNTDDDGGTNRGAVYILFMNTNGTVKSSQKISDTQGNFNEILDNSDFFGVSVTSIGDLDSDNITDIVVGADGDDDGGSGRGAVYVLFLNELDSPTITLNSPTNNANLTSVSVTFNRTVVDASGIADVSLILDGIYNETNSSGINNTDYIFTKTLSEGTHNWTYEACDTLDNCVNATVIIFTVESDTTNPTATYTCLPSTVFIGDTITCTCTGADSGSGVNTTSSPTTIIADESGSFTVSGCTVTDLAGNSASVTGSYTVIGGGGGISTPGEGEPTLQKTHLIVKINSGEEIIMTSFGGTGVKEIVIEVNQELKNVRIKVSKYDSKPTAVSVENSGKTYRYLEINTENLGDSLERATVKFEVDKTWLETNNFEKNDLTIFKFDNNTKKWNSLQTSFDGEDDNFYIYSVELNSFSFFAIGEKLGIVESIVSEITESYEKANETKLGLIIWWSIFGFLLISIIVLSVFIVREIRIRREGNMEIQDSTLSKKD